MPLKQNITSGGDGPHAVIMRKEKGSRWIPAYREP
jgi:hypothetical protein